MDGATAAALRSLADSMAADGRCRQPGPLVVRRWYRLDVLGDSHGPQPLDVRFVLTGRRPRLASGQPGAVLRAGIALRGVDRSTPVRVSDADTLYADTLEARVELWNGHEFSIDTWLERWGSGAGGSREGVGDLDAQLWFSRLPASARLVAVPRPSRSYGCGVKLLYR